MQDNIVLSECEGRHIFAIAIVYKYGTMALSLLPRLSLGTRNARAAPALTTWVPCVWEH